MRHEGGKRKNLDFEKKIVQKKNESENSCAHEGHCQFL